MCRCRASTRCGAIGADIVLAVDVALAAGVVLAVGSRPTPAPTLTLVGGVTPEETGTVTVGGAITLIPTSVHVWGAIVIGSILSTPLGWESAQVTLGVLAVTSELSREGTEEGKVLMVAWLLVCSTPQFVQPQLLAHLASSSGFHPCFR